MDNLYAQVSFDFNANFADELSVKSGEIIQILYKIDSNWVYAKTLMTPNDSGGILPVNHLEIIQLPNYLFETHENFNLKLFLATDDFGEESGDLNFAKNQLLIGQNSLDSNWYFGYYLNDQNKKGIFPVSHVTPIYYLPHTVGSTSLIINESYQKTPPRQAKATHLFENGSCNSSYSFLKFKSGDPLLIFETLDDNWYIGENINGEKGLIPNKYVEFTNKNEQNLQLQNEEIKADKSIKEQDDQILNVSKNDTAKYCRVTFDFKPEMELELGCLSGECLKILRINLDKSEWVEVQNIYGKKGMVPLSFVELIYDSDPSLEKLFETKVQFRNKSINEMHLTSYQNNKSSESLNIDQSSKSIRQNISLFQEKINQKKKESQLLEEQKSRLSKRSNQRSPKSYSTSPNISNDNERNLLTVYRPPPDPPVNKDLYRPKPPLPPKPTKIITNRPVIFNNELLTKIKDLESIIEKQNTSVSTSNEINLDKEEATFQNIESLKSNLSNMKNLFVDSAQNRQLAMAQIEPSANELINSQEKSIDLDKKLKRRALEREMTIKELYETEKNFAEELNTCYDTFVTNCVYIPSGFNRNVIFDELKPVIKFSFKLVELLREEIESNDADSIKIGSCLISVNQEIKQVYAPYLQNHANVAQLLKNYESNSELVNFIKLRMDLFKDQTKVVNLQSILIKPVQRIFKYPLFLKRIKENTDSNHIDYKNLETADELYTKTLEFINEYKRRKDLINKYLQPSQTDITDKSIGDFFKKIKIASIAKKTTRLTVQLSSALGLFNQKIFDNDFSRLDENFKVIEKTSRRFSSDLEEYLTSLKDVLNNEKLMFNHLLYIFEDEFHTFVIFETASHKRFTDQFKFFSNSIKKQIQTPLTSLINYFNGPIKLINKRNDKLVDYEASLSDYEIKSSNNSAIPKDLEMRLDQSKKDYEALNSQLIEDLPQLIKSSLKILINLIKKFLNLTHSFYAKIKLDIDQEIQKAHFQAASDIPKLNIVFQRQGSIFYSINEENHLIKKSNQSEESIWQLKTKFPPDNLYRVFKDYQPDEKLCQLSQQKNDIVGLIKPYDPAGQRHIWLVDNGFERGFIPCEVLERYTETNESNESEKQENDLISFEEDLDLISSKSEISYSNDMSQVEANKLDTKSDKYCIAIYDFKAIKNNMINLVEGKLYKVKEECDSSGNTEWWLVEDNESFGFVPANYVKLLD